jgi:hypothetical protein
MLPHELEAAVSVWRAANVARGAPHEAERTARIRAKPRPQMPWRSWRLDQKSSAWRSPSPAAPMTVRASSIRRFCISRWSSCTLLRREQGSAARSSAMFSTQPARWATSGRVSGPTAITPPPAGSTRASGWRLQARPHVCSPAPNPIRMPPQRTKSSASSGGRTRAMSDRWQACNGTQRRLTRRRSQPARTPAREWIWRSTSESTGWPRVTSALARPCPPTYMRLKHRPGGSQGRCAPDPGGVDGRRDGANPADRSAGQRRRAPIREQLACRRCA